MYEIPTNLSQRKERVLSEKSYCILQPDSRRGDPHLSISKSEIEIDYIKSLDNHQ